MSHSEAEKPNTLRLARIISGDCTVDGNGQWSAFDAVVVAKAYLDLEAQLQSWQESYRALHRQWGDAMEQMEAARGAALELREHMAYDEYGFVRAAVEHILGNSEEWERWEHSK